MSLIPLQGQDILVSTPESSSEAGIDKAQLAPGAALTAWIMQRVNLWESFRERGYGRIWAQYWRLWRGKWDVQDQNRESERSRVITPALAQAIEASVAEVEEAVFAKDVWFDIDERKTQGPDKLTALMERDQLLDDMELVNVKGAVSEAVLNAAIFGTGVVQVNVEVVGYHKPVRDRETQKLQKSKQEHVRVTAESIRPDEFIPDPAGKSIPDMLGCAVKRVKPLHAVLEKIQSGIYRKDALPYMFPQHRLYNRDIDKEIDPQSIVTVVDADEATVIEWHGKVPLGMLNAAMDSKTDMDELLAKADGPDDGEDTTYVEAIVTIANGSVLLRAMANPFTMKDRSIIAFQYETVPGRFWGRGVAEKGYNPQIALDATVRSYIDALGFISAPMLGIDSGRLLKGFKNTVYPGRVWLTAGNPSEVLSTVQVGQFQPAMFQQASEMERMVQMGTGAFDTASALNQQSQSGANSLSANSMLMGAFVKRAKRVVQNVDRHLLTPMITKFMWRYMQFDPVRYPTDFDFVVKATMGIVAREAEAMQLTQLIGMVGEEFPQVRALMAKGIIENSAVSNKAEIMQAINQALQPNPQQQQQQQQLQHMQIVAAMAQAQGAMLNNQLTIAKIRELVARSDMEAHQGAVSVAELQQETEKLRQQWQELSNQAEQNRIQWAKLQHVDIPTAHAQLITAQKKPSGNSSTSS
jgi:hypothetical protein